jgi:alpha-1,2-mannosyltransferase
MLVFPSNLITMILVMKNGFDVEKLNHFLNSRRMKYPLLIGGILWLGWLISLIAGKGPTDLTGHLIGTDYSAFYIAGKIALSGQFEKLYDLNLIHTLQQNLYLDSNPIEGITLFLNPPHFAFALAPFALLPYIPSFLLWLVLGFICLYLSVKLLYSKDVGKRFIISLTWFPVFCAASFGQNSFFTLLIFSLTYYLWKRDRHLVAGFVFSLLLYKPQFLLFLGFYFFLEWKSTWKLLFGILLGLSFQCLGCFLLLPQATLSYINFSVKVLPQLMSIEGFPLWNVYSLESFWLLLLPGFNKVASILFDICFIVGFVYYLVFWNKHRDQKGIMFAATVTWMVLFTPYISVYDWTILLLPALLFWQECPDIRPVLRTFYAIIWITALISVPLTYVQLQVIPFAVQLAVPALMIVTTLLYKKVREPSIQVESKG